MPLPTRRTGETRGAFVGRCMGSEVMKREYKDQDQRLAVCHSQARRTPKSNVASAAAATATVAEHGQPISNLESLLANYTVRREMFDGRAHAVVPVVLLTEGVHVGSGGPTMYPADEISNFAHTWNGVPVPVFHPEVDGQLVSCNHPEVMEAYNVGRLWNVGWDAGDGKLRGEVWIDIARAQSISPDVLTMIYEGRPLEVSTGLFAEEEHSPGKWGDEQYNSIARGIRPDHLALLPGGRGACSYDDGCGVRANTEEGGDQVADDDKGSRLIKMWLSNEDVSHEQLYRELQLAIDTMDSPRWAHYLRAVYDDYFVYRAEPRGGPETGDGRLPVLYKQSYSVDANGSVQMGEAEPQTVKEVVSYKSITNNQQEVVNMPKDKSDQGCCPEKVQLLIENEATPFTDDDHDWLSALTEEQIDKLAVEEQADEGGDGDGEGKSDVAKVAEETANAAMGKVSGKEDTPKAQTVDEYIANAPAEIREVLTNGLRMHRTRKAEVVKSILDNKQNSFSQQELEDMDIAILERMLKLAVADADYTGSGGALRTHAEEEEVYEMPTVNLGEDKAKAE
jgi:hypothetical protein